MWDFGFPVVPEGFNAVLGQLARWFYPFGSGAHCNNYYYYNCSELLQHTRLFFNRSSHQSEAITRNFEAMVAPIPPQIAVHRCQS